MKSAEKNLIQQEFTYPTNIIDMKHIITALICLGVVVSGLYFFYPIRKVWLEDGVATGGYWSTIDSYGGVHFTGETLSRYYLWKYRGHYEPVENN